MHQSKLRKMARQHNMVIVSPILERDDAHGSGDVEHRVAVPAGWNCFAYVRRGRVRVGEGEEAQEAPLQQVEAPLPGCLQMMLAKHVLKAAKRNELRRTRRLMESDDPACAALAKARPELQKVFDALP